MSINITVHGNTLEKVTRKTVLSDPEYIKKEQLAERRKQRLEQVRQQSKQVAQQVRKNVEEEIKRQEKRINELKQKELLEWREKALAEAEQQQGKVAKSIGTAHRAALEERQADSKIEKDKMLRNQLAKQRGRDALRIEKERKLNKLKDKSRQSTQIDKPCMQKSANKIVSAQLEKSSFIPSHLEDVEEESILSEADESKSSSSLKRNKPVLMDINTDSDDSSSSISLLDSHQESNRHFYRTKEKIGVSDMTKSSYNAHDYRQAEASASDNTNSLEKPKPRPFTKISELVEKRKSKVTSLIPSEIPRTTEISGTPVKSCLKNNPQQESAVSTIKTQTHDTLKPSANTKPRSETSNSVQFYDYDNKFSKKYEPKQVQVKSIAKPKSQMNAMDRAQVELQVQEKEKERLIGMRQKAEERGKRALETEKIRRDCEQLKHQLASLNRDYGFLCGNDPHERTTLFAAKQLDEEALERQKTCINSIANNQQNKPIEKLSNKRNDKKQETKQPTNKTSSVNETNNTCTKNIPKSIEVMSSVDSCASVFLGYVNRQSEQVSEDIKHCKDTNTVKGLMKLLEKINSLRDDIIRDIENFKINNNESSVDLTKIAQAINDLRKEREDILSEEKENIEFIKKILAKRERRLKEKERHVKRKLIQIAESQLANETAKTVKSEDDKKSTIESSDDQQRIPSKTLPIEIIIKLRNETTMSKQIKSPYKSPRKKSSLIHDFKHTKRKKVIPKQKHAEPVDKNKTKTDFSPAKSRSSTSYMSPPEIMHTDLGEILSVAPAPKNLPEKDPKIVENEPNLTQKDEKINPILMHYIQRLLGMSRSSIDMLGVSSSELETPTSSLIANPANASETNSLLVQNEHLQRLQEFINDNYSFISELEDSIKSNKSINSSNSSSKKLVEKIWNDALKKQEKKINAAILEKQLKSILKKKSIREESKRIVNTPRKTKTMKSVETQVSDLSKSEKSVEANLPIHIPTAQATEPVRSEAAEHIVDKYSELTQNCTKRIAELTDMIQKVRKEKQKILEITLTSSSERGEGSTDYKDLPEISAVKSDDGLSYRLEDLQVAIEKHLETERAGLEKNKLTGVSRDSGISLSRPVTALDSHDLPETQRLGKSPDQDILKIVSLLPKDVLEEACLALKKQQRPPATITRYSPQLVEERVHELSTIMEVETPATSRINASTSEKNIISLANQLSDSMKNIKRFQTFEEYVNQKKLEVSQFVDIDSNSKVDLEEIEEIMSQGNLKYEEFPSLNTFLSKQGQKDTLPDNTHVTEQQIEVTSFQPFPSHKSYVEKLGVSNLLDSQSISAVSISDNSQKLVDTESTESLPDVVAELKQRNILKHSFRNEIGVFKAITSSSESTSSSKECDGSKLKITSKDKTPVDQNFGTGSVQRSPCKRKVFVTQQTDTDKQLIISGGKTVEITGIDRLPTSSSKSTSSAGDSDSLGKELSEMGLKWASLMLKKSQQSMELGSTSSSFTYEHMRRTSTKKSPEKIKISPEKSKTSSTSVRVVLEKDTDKNKLKPLVPTSDISSLESGAKPFNLKEFFTKELQKRSALSGSSYSTDDSLASQFIKSLLGSAHSTPTPKSDEKTPGERQRHHTSTPVYQKSSQSSKSSQDASKLFSGESCISSVRMSPGSKKANFSRRGQSISRDSDALSASPLNIDIVNRIFASKDNKKDKSS